MFAKKKLLQPVLSRLIKSTFTQIHHLRFFFLGHSHFWRYLLTFLGCCAALHILFGLLCCIIMQQTLEPANLLASFVNHAKPCKHTLHKQGKLPPGICMDTHAICNTSSPTHYSTNCPLYHPIVYLVPMSHYPWLITQFRRTGSGLQAGYSSC